MPVPADQIGRFLTFDQVGVFCVRTAGHREARSLPLVVLPGALPPVPLLAVLLPSSGSLCAEGQTESPIGTTSVRNILHDVLRNVRLRDVGSHIDCRSRAGYFDDRFTAARLAAENPPSEGDRLQESDLRALDGTALCGYGNGVGTGWGCWRSGNSRFHLCRPTAAGELGANHDDVSISHDRSGGVLHCTLQTGCAFLAENACRQ